MAKQEFDSPVSESEDSGRRINSGARKFNTLPLVNKVNMALVNLPRQIAKYEYIRAKHIASLDTDGKLKNEGHTTYIHVNALVDAVIAFCGTVFSGITNPADSLALVKIITDETNPAYKQYIFQILLLFGMYSKNPKGLDDVREMAIKLIDPSFRKGKENIPIFSQVPETAPNAPLGQVDEEYLRKINKPRTNEKHTYNSPLEAGAAGAQEFFESLRKNRTQLQMAIDFSEMFRLRLRTHATFSRGLNNRGLIELCRATQTYFSDTNESYIVLGDDRYSIKGILSALVSNVQRLLEQGDAPRTIDVQWNTLAGYSSILGIAAKISHEKDSRIFEIEGALDPKDEAGDAEDPYAENSDDVFTSAQPEAIKTRAHKVSGKIQKVHASTETIPPHEVEPESFIPDFGDGEKTPAENTEATRQRVLADQFALSRDMVESLNERANTTFHIAQLLDSKSTEVLKIATFRSYSQSILKSAAEKVLEADRLSTMLSNALSSISSLDALETIGEVQVECDALLHELNKIDASFIAFREKASAYMVYLEAKAEQRRKAREWLDAYFAPGLFAAKRGLTYEAITETVYEPIKANVIEPIKKKTRSAIRKVLPYVLAGLGILCGTAALKMCQTDEDATTQTTNSEATIPQASTPSAAPAPTTSPTALAAKTTMPASPKSVQSKSIQESPSAQFYFNETLSNSTIFTPETSFKHAPQATGPIDFMGADHGKIVSSHIDAEKTAPSQKIVQLKKGEGLSQSALRMHTELVTQKVTESLASQGISASPLKIAQAVETHMASLKGAKSYSLALSYIGSSELNDPLIKQLDTTQSDGHTIVNPRGNVHYQAAENSYAIDLNNPAVRTEIDTSTQKILQSLAPKETGTKSFFNKTASKLGGFVKGLFR